MISKHVELGSKTENSTETASSRHRANSVVMITNSSSTLESHVLTLYNESDFTFVDFTPFPFNLVVKTSAGNFILGSERYP